MWPMRAGAERRKQCCKMRSLVSFSIPFRWCKGASVTLGDGAMCSSPNGPLWEEKARQGDAVAHKRARAGPSALERAAHGARSHDVGYGGGDGLRSPQHRALPGPCAGASARGAWGGGVRSPSGRAGGWRRACASKRVCRRNRSVRPPRKSFAARVSSARRRRPAFRAHACCVEGRAQNGRESAREGAERSVDENGIWRAAARAAQRRVADSVDAKLRNVPGKRPGEVRKRRTSRDQRREQRPSSGGGRRGRRGTASDAGSRARRANARSISWPPRSSPELRPHARGVQRSLDERRGETGHRGRKHRLRWQRQGREGGGGRCGLGPLGRLSFSERRSIGARAKTPVDGALERARGDGHDRGGGRAGVELPEEPAERPARPAQGTRERAGDGDAACLAAHRQRLERVPEQQRRELAGRAARRADRGRREGPASRPAGRLRRGLGVARSPSVILRRCGGQKKRVALRRRIGRSEAGRRGRSRFWRCLCSRHTCTKVHALTGGVARTLNGTGPDNTLEP